jgi:hypothetical protein
VYRVTQPIRARTCVSCGVRLHRTGWSYCWGCWQLKRAAQRSWHWQLERFIELEFSAEEVSELRGLRGV